MFLRSLLSVLLLIALFASASATQQAKPDTSIPSQLITLAQDILFGRHFPQRLASLAAGSRLVSSSRTADLRAVVTGKDTSMTLAEDPRRLTTGVKLKTSD
jgi:hypothetical protein